jgi:hypothetical protein
VEHYLVGLYTNDLYVLNVTDLSNITTQYFVDLPVANDAADALAVKNNYAYAGNGSSGTLLWFQLNGNGVVAQGTFLSSATGVEHMMIQNNSLFVLKALNGFDVFDITTPNNPQLIGYVNTLSNSLKSFTGPFGAQMPCRWVGGPNSGNTYFINAIPVAVQSLGEIEIWSIRVYDNSSAPTTTSASTTATTSSTIATTATTAGLQTTTSMTTAQSTATTAQSTATTAQTTSTTITSGVTTQATSSSVRTGIHCVLLLLVFFVGLLMSSD